MTLFIDLRATPSGGITAEEATVWDDGARPLSYNDFGASTRGRDIVLAAHGFNVGRASGVAALSRWSGLFQLPGSSLFVGVLWPGDSRYLPILDYPVEGEEAIRSGRLLARFINQYAAEAASISFVSHSLGARMVLEALDKLERDARRLILMAGAIEDDCLVNEYGKAAGKAQEIYILSSKSDWVLEFAFPIGNPIGELIMHGHPYFKTALGRNGPAQPIPLEQRGGAWQIPDGWNYGHLDYLPGKAIGPQFYPPIDAPGVGARIPIYPEVDGWKSSWSAGVVSTEVI
jgi:hypothetical protein